MTDTMPEQTTDEQDWTGPETDATYPEFPQNPHNHRYTISIDGRGPMLVVRANTAAEITAASEELENAEVGAAIGRAWAAFKAGAALGNGLGATPVGASPAPGAAQQVAAGYPTPAPVPPAMPGVPGQAPAAWQNAGAPTPPAPPAQAQTPPEYAQSGWYRLNVPFKQKGVFDGITAQYQMRKGRPSEGGQFSFNKADKSWYVDPRYAGAFDQFQPVPA
ncbi:hypothetical protein [Streptomyces himalayensis]|uniref:Uncharacterized protein n=1 Tax=Streptomyces himalayensis subsp. himalayensis TaxID=2756131 RepID=A0A7W0DVG7_9ACTN|nr:hypothetical protein [Streptomyces himalayensis]MBA2951463.1 hypothetical protein [Streptomyces himalayensis subsp. himalayensis]